MLGGAAEFFTPKARAIGHSMFWGLNFGLFVVLAMYIAMKTQKKEEPNFVAKWGALMLVVAGALLIMVDLTRHVLLDLELAGAELAMYGDDGDLSTVGLTGVMCTWVGLVCTLCGVAAFSDLGTKMQLAWQAKA